MKLLFLLDTTILTELLNPHPNKSVIRNLDRMSMQCAFSSLTLAELMKGISFLPENSKTKSTLMNYVNFELSTLYTDIPFDKYAAASYKKIFEELKSRNINKPDKTLMLAATAIANGMILVTHNTKDFEDIPNLMVEDWFEEN